MAVIYKLIWYQDGYEQPSEEDLKRIMNVSIDILRAWEIFSACYVVCSVSEILTAVKSNSIRNF